MSQKTVWCAPCSKSFIFFVDASAREHAIVWHQDQVQWSQKHGYYIGSPHFEAADASPELSPITRDEIIDSSELSTAQWDAALHEITDRFIVN